MITFSGNIHVGNNKWEATTRSVSPDRIIQVLDLKTGTELHEVHVDVVVKIERIRVDKENAERIRQYMVAVTLNEDIYRAWGTLIEQLNRVVIGQAELVKSIDNAAENILIAVDKV